MLETPQWPSCRNLIPNRKIQPKNFIEPEAYLSFYSTKTFTHLRLNSPAKSLFPIQRQCKFMVIVNLHSIQKVRHIFWSTCSTSLPHSMDIHLLYCDVSGSTFENLVLRLPISGHSSTTGFNLFIIHWTWELSDELRLKSHKSHFIRGKVRKYILSGQKGGMQKFGHIKWHSVRFTPS